MPPHADNLAEFVQNSLFLLAIKLAITVAFEELPSFLPQIV